MNKIVAYEIIEHMKLNLQRTCEVLPIITRAIRQFMC